MLQGILTRLREVKEEWSVFEGMMLACRAKIQADIDAIFEARDTAFLRADDSLSLAAKKGWARPEALTLDEIQALCRAVVIHSAARTGGPAQVGSRQAAAS